MATTTYNVEIRHEGKASTLTIAGDETILSAAANAGLELPSSCNAGVCTTCAGRLIKGEVDPGDSMGLSPDLQDKGFVLLCAAMPASDLVIETGCDDEVYEQQFGQFQ